jgi:hypothetical protein
MATQKTNSRKARAHIESTRAGLPAFDAERERQSAAELKAKLDAIERIAETDYQRREAIKLGIQDLNSLVGGAQSRSETLLKAAKSMISSKDFDDRDNVLHLIEMIADEIDGCARDVDGVAKRLLPVC